MENATKALLIAGSVLVAILIISLGMHIFNTSSEVTDDSSSTMESTSIMAFNKKFSQYISNSATGTEAKALANNILYNNAAVGSTSFSAGEHHVYLNFTPKNGTKLTHKWTPADIQNIINNIYSKVRYKIHITTGCDKYSGGYYHGYIICISITEL